MMKVHFHESIWLNEEDMCSLEHLAELSGLSSDELLDLIESGAILPANQDPKHYVFQMQYVVIARTARRLRDDFSLDPAGLSVALHLLRRIRDLEQELASKP